MPRRTRSKGSLADAGSSTSLKQKTPDKVEHDEGEESVDSELEQSLPMIPRAPPSAVTQADDTRTTQVNAVMAERSEEQPTGLLAWAGLGCTLFALACMCICFTSPYWFQTYPNSFNEFLNIGMWEVCFDDYQHHKDDSQEIYSGCWWVFDGDPKYTKLREWILPPWMIACQVLCTMSLIVLIMTAVIVAMIFLHACPIMNHEYHQTYAMFASAALMFLVSMICIVVACIYGAMCGDRSWMPRPDLNFLSWGYGFLIITAIVSLAAGVCMYLEAKKSFGKLMEKEDEFFHATQEMMAQSGDPMMYGGPPSYATQPSFNSQGYPGGDFGYSGQPSFDKQQSMQSFDKQPSFEKQPSYGQQPSFEKQPSYGQQPSFEKQPSYGQQPSFEKQPSYGQQSYGQPDYGQPSYGQPNYGQPSFNQPYDAFNSGQGYGKV